MAKQNHSDKITRNEFKKLITEDEVADFQDTSDKETVTDIIIPDSNAWEFVCPNCGKIPQNDVIFLCNTCENSELIYKDGIYMCPQCLYPGDNFECMKCGSKQVKMRHKHVAK